MKVLASDFDNTLFVEEEISFEENIKSIREFMLMGNIFIIITGRSYTDLKQMLNKYKIPYNYLFCEDGARIYNNMDLCIDEVKINHEKVENILEILENYNCGYILDDGIEETTDTKNVVKVVIPYTDKKLASKILRDITKHVEIYGYISNNYINIISHKINKYLSLKKFIKIEEIKESKNNEILHFNDRFKQIGVLENFIKFLKKPKNMNFHILVGENYITSDNPVIMLNEGKQIFIPISNNICVTFQIDDYSNTDKILLPYNAGLNRYLNECQIETSNYYIMSIEKFDLVTNWYIYRRFHVIDWEKISKHFK